MKKPIPFGKYTLLERINVGGMAEVFRAKAFGVEGFERVVAVKRILPNIAEDQDFITMFIDEAKIAVQLNHANIAQIFDLGVVDAFHYIALEHVWGRDLRGIFERCKQRGEPMPVAQACFIVMKMCEGLDYAHNKRDSQGREMHLVHRDVSPQNVLVSFEGEVKLIDFGIAKAAGKVGKTQAGILKGKFGYMSPEQVRGLPIDRRSDIFSNGIVLYELLTGERLFVGESDFSTLEKVRNVEILPPSTYNRKIPDELERIVLKALAKDVEDRYQNAIDLHDELQAFVYTAGEFYSRKDLAAWMKKTFAREIEDEAAKLEAYRHATAPPALDEPTPSAGKRARTTQAVAVPPPPPPPANGRNRAPATLRDAGPPGALREPAPPPPAPTPGKKKSDLDWDDDELETQIYGDAPPHRDEPAAKRAAKTTAPMGSQSLPPSLSDDMDFAVGPPAEPVPPAAAMTAKALKARPSNDLSLPRAAPPRSDSSIGGRVTVFPEVQTRRPPSPTKMYVLAGAGVAVLGLLVFGGITLLSDDRPAERTKVSPAAPPVQAAPAPPPIDPNSGFDVTTDPPRAKVVLDGNHIGESPLRVRSLLAGKHKIEIEPPAGFKPVARDIVVEQGKAEKIDVKLEHEAKPAGETPRLAVVKVVSDPVGARVSLLDGGARTVLGLAPTEAKLDASRRYQVVFELEGYEPQTRDVTFSADGQAEVKAMLTKSAGGAPVVSALPAPDEPKPAPPAAKAAPKAADKPPRPAPARPVVRKPAPKPAPKREVASAPKASPKEPRITTADGPVRPAPPEREPSPREPRVTGPAESNPPPDAAQGKLSIGAKPPCAIFIDGKDTGRMTPAIGLEVKPGTVTVLLVNGEFGIKEKFTVTVKAGETTKIIKDFSDRIPQ